ncbi:MAG: hypothetical protein ACYDAI_11735 [Trichloromonadaceae bacterium]
MPKPTATALLDPATNALSWSAKGVNLSVKLVDQDVARTQMIDRVASFSVTAANLTGKELTLPLSSYLLVDDQGNQVRPITPEELLRIVSRESFYLIPYPYFGYYYLEDRAKLSSFNTMTSPLPYFPENHPQAILTEAVPTAAIVPGAKVSGLVYFLVDFEKKQQIEFRAYLPGADTSAAPDFSFPFSVEKK